ncbi:MAG: type I restriction-modification system subunit M [Bacteroidetes bacterium]|nr:type I restriction-modification system subunit M [Bacteroidota bacterium]
MAIKKSELYSSLWASCDALRGGMDASQYKDYVLVMLFLKYVSDKAGSKDTLIEVPKGCSFSDIAALKGHKEIGEKINTSIGAIAKANDLQGFIDVVSFNDDEKLGSGKEKIDRLSELVAIFEKPELDFRSNRAEGDDILGDAYEYLMRHFATESGKSKGQFYTPAEVSRIIAKVIGINRATSGTQTIYDPTCGSGSLLLRAAAESEKKLSLYGQEKEGATAALAKMNMILHNNDTALIAKGQSTLSNPQFEDNRGNLKTFDFVVANPPFSLKNWTQGFNPAEDIHERFTGFGIPPDKNGDYAFFLHIVRSLNQNGKGAVILPHGVLFRGNTEGEIRKNVIKRGLIKGIIGLPSNLFYGTGIPACIIVLDKEDAEKREGIFMIDASKGFVKDGNKNRLREQDIHKTVDVFNKQIEIPKYSRFVKNEEIADPKNDYNLNIPRYIDSQEPEDIQDIEAHLLGDIPVSDIDALSNYWSAYPSLRKHLFGKSTRAGYVVSKIQKDKIKETIFTHPDFVAFTSEMDQLFAKWRKTNTKYLKQLSKGCKPKEVIAEIAEDLLQTYTDKPLLDRYDIYQYLLDYWKETMQDDCYLIAGDGWKAEPRRITERNKKGAEVDKGWTCDLVPPSLIVEQHFANERDAMAKMEAAEDAIKAQLTELEEDNSGEDGWFADFEKVNKGSVSKRLKEIGKDRSSKEEIEILTLYLKLTTEQTALGIAIKEASEELSRQAFLQYRKLTADDIKTLVVDHKWMTAMESSIKSEMERVSQRLTNRIRELVERYETPLPQLNESVAVLEEKVNAHLRRMGFKWE